MYDKIVDILCAIKEDQPELRHSLSPSTDLNNDIGLDSLQMIQFMLKVEEQLNVAIDYDQFDYEHLESIEAFISFLKSCQSQAQPQYEDVQQ
ncbi:acyl carrier protein [Paenibacillus chitinolyticus]|uniref:Acyl carrier protein n=1 Tax=Paenibacillus chitinolyticus TaxID=79263 RepID=A0A410X3W4_9BACL|nr:acyl carrier protein [Paenibacillus chitinolyticus]MCY9590026.1 acyl carrier protein [Paenibacillus chitinolyticus]MCY9597045.1 acyl carrier protein [Paenibacillus chitinolyticus]QAV21312.1 acyl carrier protein [Paenibacillus chitinolyticus]